MNRRWLPTATLLLTPLMVSCAPYWYSGTAAVLEGTSVTVAHSAKDWGNCSRTFSAFPTAYKLSTPKYEIQIAHGRRYWPQLFMVAVGTNGEIFELRGPGVSLIKYPRSREIEQLKATTSVVPTHELDLRNVPEQSIRVQVLGSNHEVIGEETIPYRVEKVGCFEWDSL